MNKTETLLKLTKQKVSTCLLLYWRIVTVPGLEIMVRNNGFCSKKTFHLLAEGGLVKTDTFRLVLEEKSGQRSHNYIVS